MKARTLPGFRDFYPEIAALRTHIFRAWRTVASRYGFEEYDGPPLEALALYTKKSGDEIVEQLYHFEDKGGRAVALRPEMTPTLARMVTARANALKKPIRWFSVPQLFRYERQQRGRLREHFQLNVDVIGETSPMADAEVIAVAIDIMRALELDETDVRVRLSDRRLMAGILQGVGVAERHLPDCYAVIDKIDRDEHDSLRRMLEEIGLETSVAESVLAVGRVRGMEAARAAAAEAGVPDDVVEPVTQCVDALDAMGLGRFVDVDLSIVRGLAYYTGIVFELFDAQQTLRAICGGGRYDDLLRSLGGVDLPAVGFGMGDVVLGELLKDRGWSAAAGERLDVFLVAVTREDVPTVLSLGHELRDRGLRVEYALKPQAMTKQLNIAAARPAKRVVIVGPEEREAGEAVVRDLGTGEESRIPAAALLDDHPWGDG